MAASKTLTPEQRTERARKAGRAAHSTEHYIKVLMERESSLTEDQKSRLRALGGAAR